MDLLATPALFVMGGFVLAVLFAFFQSMLLGDFEQGLGSALALAAIGTLAFVVLYLAIGFIGYDATLGLGFAIGFAFVGWALAFQFSYDYTIFQSWLYAAAITTSTTLFAFGVPYLLTYFGM